MTSEYLATQVNRDMVIARPHSKGVADIENFSKRTEAYGLAIFGGEALALIDGSWVSIIEEVKSDEDTNELAEVRRVFEGEIVRHQENGTVAPLQCSKCEGGM